MDFLENCFKFANVPCTLYRYSTVCNCAVKCVNRIRNSISNLKILYINFFYFSRHSMYTVQSEFFFIVGTFRTILISLHLQVNIAEFSSEMFYNIITPRIKMAHIFSHVRGSYTLRARICETLQCVYTLYTVYSLRHKSLWCSIVMHCWRTLYSLLLTVWLGLYTTLVGGGGAKKQKKNNKIFTWLNKNKLFWVHFIFTVP